MLKKIFIVLICSVFLCTTYVFAKESNINTDAKPLKIEQKTKDVYKYGDFEKNVKNPNVQEDKEDNFSNILKHSDHKEPSVLRIFNSLIFVIILILITGWVYMKIKRINPEQLLSGKFTKLSENNFKIVSSLQLGAGKSIYLIEINNKQLIVGTTSTNVNLLAQMDKKDNNKEIPQECIEKLFENKDEKFKKLDE